MKKLCKKIWVGIALVMILVDVWQRGRHDNN